MRKTTLLALTLLGTAPLGGAVRAAELKLAACPAAPDGGRICLPVELSSGGARVASAGFTVAYDTRSLRLPNGSADVQAGGALAAGQGVATTVTEDANGGRGRVQVTITPPVRLPIAVIGDGPVARICFTTAKDATGGCASARLESMELGDDSGRQLAARR